MHRLPCIRYTNSCSLLFNLSLFMPALTKVVWCPYHQSRKVFFVENRNLRLRVFAIATCGSNQLYCAHFEVSPVPVRVFYVAPHFKSNRPAGVLCMCKEGCTEDHCHSTCMCSCNSLYYYPDHTLSQGK